MAKNIIQLVPAPTIEQEVNAVTVERLREALAHAEAGRFVGVVIMGILPDGSSSVGHSTHLAGHEVLGLLEMAKLDFYERNCGATMSTPMAGDE